MQVRRYTKAVGTVSLAEQLQSLGPAVQSSPWPGHEWVDGFGVMAMPFTSGHVLVLRAFPRNSFAPYKSVWHRTPEGTWTIFVDGAPIETACPRYPHRLNLADPTGDQEMRRRGPTAER